MKIALLGHGTVGSGVCQLLLEKRDDISAAAGRDIILSYILDRRDFSALPYSDLFVTDIAPVLSDPAVSIVVEALGGLEPAFGFVRSCLEHGKSVVTSNKELVAEKGAELLSIAREHNVNFLFEASVGGGIPLIRPLYECMSTAGITDIFGILNGTTNYILTRMFRDGADYNAVLAEAQRLGYAERDPSDDVNGVDACRKLAILCSLVWGQSLYPNEIPTEGISAIIAGDVSAAAKMGFAVKLVARAKQLEHGKIAARVSPVLIPAESPLSAVNDVYNAVLVRAATTGDVLFYGKGAGKMPTAASVISDVIAAAKAEGNIPKLFWADGAQSAAAPADSLPERYFFRTENLSAEEAAKLLPSLEHADEHGFLTPPLFEHEAAALRDELARRSAFISKIPVLE